MTTMTIKMADDQHERLRRLAKQNGVTANQFLKELSIIALAQFDAEARFRARARKGNPAKGLKVLNKLDQSLGGQ